MQTSPMLRPRCTQTTSRPRRRLTHGKDNEEIEDSIRSSKGTDSYSESDKEPDEQGMHGCIAIIL